jgi:hypothetical protein
LDAVTPNASRISSQLRFDHDTILCRLAVNQRNNLTYRIIYIHRVSPWRAFLNEPVNSLYDGGGSVAIFHHEFNRLSCLIKFGWVFGEPSQTRIAAYRQCRKRLLEFMSDGRRQLPPSL